MIDNNQVFEQLKFVRAIVLMESPLFPNHNVLLSDFSLDRLARHYRVTNVVHERVMDNTCHLQSTRLLIRICLYGIHTKIAVSECARSIINFHPRKQDVDFDMLEMFGAFNVLNMTRTDG